MRTWPTLLGLLLAAVCKASPPTFEEAVKLSESIDNASAKEFDTTPEQVEAQFSSALAPGEDSEAIEAYFKKLGLEFSYDRFSNRYQSIIRHPESNRHAITIYVLLDAQKRFVGVEARDSYTSL